MMLLGESVVKYIAKLIILSTALAGVTIISGCNKPQESASTTKPNSSVTAEISDADVTTNVKTVLLRDETAKNFDITVVTLKGDVRLTGVVDNQAQLDQIDALVRSVNGVHSIHDELTLKK